MIDCIGCSKYEAKLEQKWHPGQPVAGIFSYGTLNTTFDRMLTVAHWLEVHYPNLRLWREVDHEILTEFLAEKQETCATSTMRTYLAELKKLQNVGLSSFSLKNWWALFILIPAIGAFDAAVRMYRAADNHLTAPARSSLFIGLILTLVTVSFLLDISWTIFGPVLLILTGIGLAVNAMLPDGKE